MQVVKKPLKGGLMYTSSVCLMQLSKKRILFSASLNHCTIGKGYLWAKEVMAQG
jgi:hypothetical protein